MKRSANPIIWLITGACLVAVGTVWFLRSGILGLDLPEVKMTNPTKESSVSKAPSSVFYRSIGDSTPVAGESGGTSTGSGGYTVEIGVTHKETEAKRMVEEFAKLGVDAYYTPLHFHGKVVFRVRRGVYDDRATAEQEQSLLQAKNVKGTVQRM